MTGLACFGASIVMIISIVGSAILNGWVLSTMWQWFIVPLFHAPVLTIPYAIGISLMIGMFSKSSSTSSDNKGEGTDWSKVISALLAIFLSPLFVLFMGWIVRMFLG